MNRCPILQAAIVCMALAQPSALAARTCPANSSLVETRESPTRITRICKCRKGYEPQGAACVPMPDVIDPRWLAMPGQAERIRARLDALAVQRAFFEDQRRRLYTVKGGIDHLWRDNVVATRSLLQDAQSQTLDLLDGLAGTYLPRGSGRAVGNFTSVIQAYVYYYAYANAADEQRARDRMIDAVGALKNLVATHPSLVRGSEAQSVKSATDSVVKLYKILDRQRRSPGVRFSNADLEDAHGAMVDAVQAVSRIGGPLRIATSQANLTIGVPYALRRLQWDLAEIEEAQRSNRTALRYYEDRLAHLSEEEALLLEGLRLER